MNRMRRMAPALLVLMAVLTSGCRSTFVRAGEERVAPPPPTDAVGTDVGTTADDASAAATGTAGGAAGGGAGEATGPGAASRPASSGGGGPEAPFNETVTVHPASGLQLTFVVGDKLEFRADETIDLELTVRNTASGVRWIDSNTAVHFAFWLEGAEEPAWTDRACFVGRDFEDIQTSGVRLAHGEEVAFAHEYPDGGFQTQADRPDCRVPPGTYLAVGQVAWCPEDTLVRFDYQGYHGYSCDQTQVVTIVSQPLPVTILQP